MLALNTLEFAALGALATLSSVAVLASNGAGAPAAMTLAWLIVLPACVTAVFWFTASKRVERIARLPQAAPTCIRRRPFRWAWVTLRAGLADAVGGVVLVRRLLARPARYRAGVAGYPHFWASDLLCLYAGLRAFDVHLPASSLVLAYTTASVITALPLPPAGPG